MTTDLPKGWVEARLDELAQIGAGGPAPQDKSHFSANGHLFVRVQDLGRLGSCVWIFETADRINEAGVSASRLRLVPAGSILFTKSGMSTLLNQRAILASDTYVVSHIGYATPHDGILSQWLYWFLKQTDLGALAHATTLPSLKLSKVAEVRVLVAPTAEQRRIVAEIEKQFTRLEAAVAALKRVQANLKCYRAAVLKSAEGRLVPTEAELARAEGRSYEPADQLLQRILAERRARWEAAQLAKFRASGKEPKDDKWKAKYKEPGAPETAAHEIPEGWTLVNLGQVAWSVKDGPHYSPSYVEAGIPFITGGQVRPSGVDFASAKRISPETHAQLCQRCRPERGDVLYTKGGTTGIARVNTYDTEFSVWVHVAVLKLVETIEPFYIQHALNSPDCYAQAQRFTHGVGNQDLGLTRMIRITFGLPPLAEQQRIVAEVDRRLSIIEELEMQVEANLKRAERLRQAILKRAFEGKLVPQDPDDEPASVLLGRIRAEREAKKQAASGTKRGRQAKRTRAVAAAKG